MIKPAAEMVDLNCDMMAARGSNQKIPVVSNPLAEISWPVAMATNISTIPMRKREILMSIFLMSMKMTMATARIAATYISIVISILSSLFSPGEGYTH